MGEQLQNINHASRTAETAVQVMKAENEKVGQAKRKAEIADKIFGVIDDAHRENLNQRGIVNNGGSYGDLSGPYQQQFKHTFEALKKDSQEARAAEWQMRGKEADMARGVTDNLDVYQEAARRDANEDFAKRGLPTEVTPNIANDITEFYPPAQNTPGPKA